MARLGQILITRNKISQEQLQEALLVQREKKHKLGKVLIELGYISEEDFMRALAESKNLEFIRLKDDLVIPKEVENMVPYDYAFKNKIVPVAVSKDGSTLYIATSSLNEVIFDDLKHISGNKNIVPKLTMAADIGEYFDSHAKKSFEEMITGIYSEATLSDDADKLEVVKDEEIGRSEDQAPAVKVVNEIMMRAVEARASDIHLEPYERGMYLRYRIDGVLYDQPALPKKLQNSVISRIKIMAKLDIAERRLPQDGRIKIRFSDKEIDLRISILPTIHGEKAVIRILDPGSLCVDLGRLGIEPEALELYKARIKTPYGIILVTGPTGSGKTTTLYSTITTINSRNINIVTIEDPVEYVIQGINQAQCLSDIGFSFANALRSFLRQDPDVIMVGEIRDTETAEIAINAALTGHLVLSTLHTNDAAGAITRLINMGIEPFLISSTLIMSVAQRLVRRLCPDCRQPIEWMAQKLNEMGIDTSVFYPPNTEKVTLYFAKGCNKCMNTGYVGRIGCYEIMDISDSIRELIVQRASAQEIKDYAITHNNMSTIRKDALRKLFAGVTTLKEVLRVSSKD